MTTYTHKITWYVGLDWPRPEDAKQRLLEEVKTFEEPATVTFGHGIWQGLSEEVAVVTMLDNGEPDHWHITRAEELADVMKQDSVLVTVEPIEADLVEVTG